MDNRKQLYRSDDAMLAGVCGGLAEYFNIDATLVRFVAVVLVLLGVGTPILAYLILLFVMPKKPVGYQPYVEVKVTDATPKGGAQQAPVTDTAAPASVVGAGAAAATAATTATSYATTVGPQNGYGYTVSPGGASCARPSSPGSCYTASNSQAFDAVTPDMVDEAGGTTRQNKGAGELKPRLSGAIIMGILLVGVGLCALLGQFIHISIWSFWPMVLVIVGLITLFTPGREGWRLERAGSGIVLITIGVILLFCMLGLIPAGIRVFIHGMMHLWPVILITAGLSILGGALKSSVFSLLGALLLSATLVFGAWYYGQFDGFVSFDGPGDLDIALTVPPSPGGSPGGRD
jgi:phage shock protein C